MTALKLSVDRTVPQKPIESTEMLQCQFAVYVTLTIVISESASQLLIGITNAVTLTSIGRVCCSWSLLVWVQTLYYKDL